MVTPSSADRRNEQAAAKESLALERLDLLTCGCVVSVQRVGSSALRLVTVEAKGLHCPFTVHRLDQVFRLGDPADWLDDEDEGMSDVDGVAGEP